MTESSHLSLYARHERRWRQNKYVYPVISRRSHGLSIDINLNLDGLCNFDCIYCSVEALLRPPAPLVALDTLRGELAEILRLVESRELFRQAPFDLTPPELRRLNGVAFSGDGEPTACARFPEACEVVAQSLQNHQLTETRIVVITNATLLRRPHVKEALAYLDGHHGEIWAKLDAGLQTHHERVARTTIPLANVLANILDTARIRPIVIQSMFLKIHDVRPSEQEISAWLQQLEHLRCAGAQIKLVQVCTVDRPAAEPFVAPLEPHALNRIVRRVKQIGLNAESFYAPN